MKSKSQIIGTNAEQEVINYLIKNKFKIVEKNFSWKYGEIDVIVQKENTIHFVEVKKRKYLPEELYEILPNKKINALKRTAFYFVEENNYDYNKYYFQFDLVIVINSNIHYFEDIFEVNSNEF